MKSGKMKSNWFTLSRPLFLDISLFIGARSDVGQSDWSWNDGSKISDSTFPTSDPNECQQMTWPLTYDDGVNLRAKHCNSGLARYFCRVNGEFVIFVKSLQNPNVLSHRHLKSFKINALPIKNFCQMSLLQSVSVLLPDPISNKKIIKCRC